MSASEGYLNAITRLGEAKAQAQSEAARQNGQIWGNTISNIGQMVAQYPEQQAKLKEIANRADLTNLEKQKFQDEQQRYQDARNSQQQMAQVIAQTPKTPDGLFDIPALSQKFSNVAPDQADKVLGAYTNINKYLTDHREQRNNAAADLANGFLSLHDPKEPIDWDSVNFYTAGLGPEHVSPQDQDLLAKAQAAGADPRQVMESIRSLGKKYQKETEPVKLGPGDVLTQRTPTGYQTVASNPKSEAPKTKEEILFDSLNPKSPTQQVSAAAWQKQVDDEANAIKNKPLTPYEQAELKNRDRGFVMEQKRLDESIRTHNKVAAAASSSNLADTIVAHPELWNQLTPTTKGQLAGALADKGFTGFAAKEPAAMETRLASSKAVLQTGADMVKLIKENAGELGPLMGRYNSVADFVGNPPPKFKELAGLIESYSLANMGVHGMRSANASEAIKQTIGEGKQTPESMIATITGLNGFAGHLLQNEGRDVPVASPTTSGLPVVGGTFQGGKVTKITPVP
jgi:hypothetical protein